MAKKCAFCKKTANSGEHIFSAWMLRMVPPQKLYLLRDWNVRLGKFIRYPARNVNLKAKVVCERCNNTWMSDLENNHLKPAIKDLLFTETPSLIQPKHIAPIAAFAFKTLIVANHRDLTTTPFFPSAVRTKFRRDLRIPDGVQVWMSTRETLAGKYYGFWKSAHGGINEKSPYSFRLYACTWNFQNLVLQILCTKWDNKKRRNTVPPAAFPQPTKWEGASVLIWPPSGNAVPWPPLFYLGDNAVQAFADRWNEFRVTNVPV